MSKQLIGQPLEQVLYDKFLQEGQSYLAFVNALDRFAAQRGAEAVQALRDVFSHIDKNRMPYTVMMKAKTILDAPKSAPPQTGGGDAGERDVTRQAIWAYYGYDVDVNDIDPDSAEAATIERIEAALRSSRQEGAEAMREACAKLAWDWDENRSALVLAMRALPIPGSKTDAG